MNFDIGCSCCPDAPPSKIINGDPVAWKAVLTKGVFSRECQNCGCEHELTMPGSQLVLVDRSKPQIFAITVPSGLIAGGTAVVLEGHALDMPGLVVKFGGIPATDLRNPSDEQVTVTTPAHALGMVDVAVENSNGQHATKSVLRAAFNYTP